MHPPPRSWSSAGSAEPGAQRLQCTLAALGALAALALLFAARALDDNRLVSWRWVFAPSDLPQLLGWHALALAAAYALSRARWETPRAAPALALAAFAASAPFWSEPEVLLDAARYFVQAKHFALYGAAHFAAEWGRAIPAWTDLPLVPLLHGLVFRLAGESRPAVQLLHALLFAGTVALTYRLGRALADRETGACAAVLLLGAPYLYTQVPLLLADVPAMFFLALSACATLAALERGGAARLAAAAAALAAALFTKYSAWIALAIPPLATLSRPAAERRAAAARAAVVVFGALAAASAFAAAKSEVIAAQLALLWSYQLPALGRWQESPASTFFFQVHPFVSGAALASAAVACRRRDRGYAWLGVLLAAAVALGLRRARYLVVALPLLALAGAYALRALREAPTRRLLASCAAASAFAVALAGYLPFLRATSAVNLARAGELLDALEADAAEVVALAPGRSSVNPTLAVPLLDLYTRSRLRLRQDLSGETAAPAALERSPVRFTWEWPPAPFHLAPGAGGTPLVVVAETFDAPLPAPLARVLERYALVAEFAATDGVFRHRTLVRIYRPA